MAFRTLRYTNVGGVKSTKKAHGVHHSERACACDVPVSPLIRRSRSIWYGISGRFSLKCSFVRADVLLWPIEGAHWDVLSGSLKIRTACYLDGQ